ncbi:polysaccharide pyruvyl transferase family protein [Leucobacter musarum]|uniref:polysaccharide pyruvyl transferase family protein n=1 Tax=Leucobacter musarum TaxID=1930747 RepID=UPI0006A7A3EC|nr:polysaccharide pyruvyl transferase family protein [Leucobacter musarum]
MSESEQPDISVIVVTYNDAVHLAAAVQSVLDQSLASIEVIISDDHSADHTPIVAGELAASDARVVSHRRSENAGAPGAPLNDGLDRARGRYVMFLGSDDVLAPGACAALLEAAARTGSEIVSGQLVRVMLGEGGERRPWFPELYRAERTDASLADFPDQLHDTLTTNKLYSREFLTRIGARFPEGMFYEDVAFSAETLAQANGITLIPNEVYEWNVYPREERESITNQRATPKNLEDRLRALDLAEQSLAASGLAVLREFHRKTLTHHLRFYLNDFLTADDDWCEWVLETVRPRLERTPLDAFRSGFLGDRALYAAALEGDISAVRAVLRGKQAGALAGHVYTNGGVTFWAPRGPESRPHRTELARELSDVTDRAARIASHATLVYAAEILDAELDDTVHEPTRLRLRGTATDLRGVLADSRTVFRVIAESNAAIARLDAAAPEVLATDVDMTVVPEGVTWEAAIALPEHGSGAQAGTWNLSLVATDAAGTENVIALRRPHAGTDAGAAAAVITDGWTIDPDPDGRARLSLARASHPGQHNVIVIGDVSWRGRYHLGDEAMTEAAIDQLRAQGLGVTLVAGDPELSAAFYGVPTVPVFGFAKLRTDAAREERADAILAGAHGEAPLEDADAASVRAVLQASAVVIAGGGNMNSSGAHHIYERLVLTRLAAHAGIPVYVSSQTVGPHLLPEHRGLVQEIVQTAAVFGSRERATTALMRELAGDRGVVVQTLDDALLLTPAELTSPVQDRVSLPERYVVGSFTYHAFSTGLSREEYYRALAGMLDDVVESNDVDVILLPHMGVLGPARQSGEDNDEFGHDRIAAWSRTGRVRSLPLVSAREVFGITAGARFSISTRYHPVVFGAALGVPAIGVVTSYYSALRMRGALSQFGMESFAIPFEHWGLFGPRVLEALRERRDEFAQHSRQVGESQQAYQRSWWAGIAASIVDAGEPLRSDASLPDAFEWSDAADADLLAVARVAQEGTNMYRMNNLFTVDRHETGLNQHTRDLEAVAKRLTQLSEGVRRADALAKRVTALERVQKDTEALIADLRHRMRPPGAALRDRVRGALRRGREQ